MCYGSVCCYEDCDGECARPPHARCPLLECPPAECPAGFARARLEKRLLGPRTDFYCPNCKDDGCHSFLKKDPDQPDAYFCPDCGFAYAGDALREDYRLETENLLSDLAHLRRLLDALDRASNQPEQTARKATPSAPPTVTRRAGQIKPEAPKNAPELAARASGKRPEHTGIFGPQTVE